MKPPTIEKRSNWIFPKKLIPAIDSWKFALTSLAFLKLTPRISAPLKFELERSWFLKTIPRKFLFEKSNSLFLGILYFILIFRGYA